MRVKQRQQGFTLIEIMIALTLGLMLSGAVVQIMVSNSLTERLNRAVASAQESGRFAISRLRTDILMTGMYDPLSPNLSLLVDPVEEAAFVQNHPIPIPGDFVNEIGLGALQGLSGANDTLVVGMQGLRDCRGYKLGYADNEEFYVVNQYFVDGTQLKCRGYDGRYLRGQKAAEGHNGHAAFTLLDDVHGFQVQYGIANNTLAPDSAARPITYVTADQLAAQFNADGQVVAIRIALLLKGDGDVQIDPVPSFSLLNETPVTPGENRLFKQFETTITLRNMKNFLGGVEI